MTSPTGARHRIGPPPASGLRRIIFGLAAAAFLAVFVVPWLASVATDWLWFREVHFESVFTTSLAARATLFVIAATVAFVFLYANFWWAQRRFVGVPALFLNRNGVAVDLTPVVSKLLLVAALFVAFITGLFASAQWMSVLLALHAVAVGAADPVFGRDIGFYLFRLPTIAAVLSTLVVLTIL